LCVDRAIGEVLDELRAENRLDNTLLMFTADNGMTWGQHRLGETKEWPYATPLPLYVRWPAAHWGDTPQTVSEVVSDIDYAPTFCALAGPACVLGPFNRGSTGPDGVSLVGLLNGDATNLGRDAVLEESFSSPENSWSGLRTTELFDPDARWHYVEYANGERELYDSVNDPWELQNLAGDAAYDDLMATLHARLAQLRVEGIASGTGMVVMREDAAPDSSFDYHFSGDLGSFVLDDDGGSDATHSNEITFNDVPSGVYTITKPQNLPWVFGGVTCDGVGVQTDSLGTLTIYVHPTETVTCTWLDAQRQPDASASLTSAGPYKLDNFYRSTPVRKQTVRRTGVAVGKTYSYYVRVQNDSAAADYFDISATTSGPSTVSSKFVLLGNDVTAAVLAGTYETSFNAGGMLTFRVRVTIGAGTPVGSPYTIVVTARSKADPSRVDVVRLIAVR